MRVLLCLLSEQHVPNLLSVHHYQPDRLVLVESAAMRKRRAAAHFLAAFQLGGLDYESQAGQQTAHIESLEAEDSLDSIRQTLRQAYSRYPDAEWLINVTGGTKPMSIATYDFFNGLIRGGELQGRLLYTNLAQPQTIIDLDTNLTEVCNHRLSIKQFLAGYGFESRKSETKLKEARQRARQWWEGSRKIASREGNEPLLILEDNQRKRARNRGLNLQPEHFHPAAAKTWRGLARCLSLRVVDGLPRGRIDKHLVEFLTGGWLEVFLWGLLERHANDLDIWDLQLGLEVGHRDGGTGNDFDVSFMRANGLSMIECKSGSQSHDSGGDILYKIEAVIRQFRALRVQSYLATTANNVFDQRTGRLKQNIATRVAVYGCRLILHEDIRRLAAAPEDSQLVRRVLFPGSKAAGPSP